jgi:hypothetical protein
MGDSAGDGGSSGAVGASFEPAIGGNGGFGVIGASDGPAAAGSAMWAAHDSSPRTDARLTAWLQSLGLSRHSATFAGSSFEDVLQMSNEDLVSRGLALGSRKKLLAACAEARQQMGGGASPS